MGTAISAAEAAALRHAYGLDQSLFVQYVKWLNLIVHGEFGDILRIQPAGDGGDRRPAVADHGAVLRRASS